MLERQKPMISPSLAALNRNAVEFVIVGAHAVAFPRLCARHQGPRPPDPAHAWRTFPECLPRSMISDSAPLGLKEADFMGTMWVQLRVSPNRVDILSEISGVDTEKVWETRGERNVSRASGLLCFAGMFSENKQPPAAARPA